ncbi:MAG TPA: hypothetical protein VIS06_19060, partial [Mycobacteriales bacterium]
AGPIGAGALAGLAAGTFVGVGLDYAYDHYLPQGVKNKIEDGIGAVGHAVSHEAKKVWDSIF